MTFLTMLRRNGYVNNHRLSRETFTPAAAAYSFDLTSTYEAASTLTVLLGKNPSETLGYATTLSKLAKQLSDELHNIIDASCNFPELVKSSRSEMKLMRKLYDEARKLKRSVDDWIGKFDEGKYTEQKLKRKIKKASSRFKPSFEEFTGILFTDLGKDTKQQKNPFSC